MDEKSLMSWKLEGKRMANSWKTSDKWLAWFETVTK
jgi:hypothetical protein